MAAGSTHLRAVRMVPVALLLVLMLAAARPAPAHAGLCGAIGFFGGWAGRACSAVTHPGKWIKAGKSLVTGHPGKAVKAIFSSGAGKAALGLAALVTWVVVGAKTALHATAALIAKTTTPQLRTTWFSATYWRMAAVAALLTLPFLFAAAIQAIMRSDLAMLLRAGLGYLPLALLAVSIAAPVVTLLLAATDQMSAIVSSAGRSAGGDFLAGAGVQFGVLGAVDRSPFLTFFVALMTSAVAVALWLELLMRDAAVYIVVLMLPLTFAAMVWPARRVWAVRTAELLVALILAKFVVVAILALGGAALGRSTSAGGLMVGLVLLTLAALSPWGLLRLLPLAELAGSAAGHMSGEFRGGLSRMQERAGGQAAHASEAAGAVVAGMRRDAMAVSPVSDPAVLSELAGPTSGLSAGNGHRGGVLTAVGAGEGSSPSGGAPATGAPDSSGPQPPTPQPPTPQPPSITPGAGDAPAGPDPDPPDRLPGLPEIYQADDLSWDPIVAGPDGVGPGPLWPEVGRTSSDADPGDDDHGAPPAPPAPPGPPGPDDHDPRPPGQEPEDGRL